MLNKKEFVRMRAELTADDEKRETVIQTSRIIIQLSKKIIYALHRGDTKSAETHIKAIEKRRRELDAINGNLDVKINQAAYQEYVEALTYYGFLKAGKLPTKASLKIDTTSYLLGLCDLTGELVRKAVNAAIKGDTKLVIVIKELVSDIYDQFLNFDLRNSELRQKSDQIKWNLKKLEDLVLEIKLRK